MKLREIVAAELGLNSDNLVFADSHVGSRNRRITLADAARNRELIGKDDIEYGDLSKKYRQSTFGAHFVEAAVNAATCEIRIRRMLAVCSAGRILNPTTARSQVIGAMTMVAGAALMEDSRSTSAPAFSLITI